MRRRGEDSAYLSEPKRGGGVSAPTVWYTLDQVWESLVSMAPVPVGSSGLGNSHTHSSHCFHFSPTVKTSFLNLSLSSYVEARKTSHRTYMTSFRSCIATKTIMAEVLIPCEWTLVRDKFGLHIGPSWDHTKADSINASPRMPTYPWRPVGGRQAEDPGMSFKFIGFAILPRKPRSHRIRADPRVSITPRALDGTSSA